MAQPGENRPCAAVMRPLSSCDDGRCLTVVCRTAAQIGRQLAYIGDSINERHSAQFTQMIRLMNLTPETAYEAFAGIARKYVALSVSLSRCASACVLLAVLVRIISVSVFLEIHPSAAACHL